MARDFPRSRRIEDQIQRILSDVVRGEVRDPRLANAIITAVRVSKDLSVAWVYYTVLKVEGEAESLDDAFERATGFLRNRLARDLTVRRVPELRFELDETVSNARTMDRLIDAANEPEHGPDDPDDDNPQDE
ncbi:MAG: 30S ribosome-binding factor RbfA [Gammaproteobacteria bacterium]|jgi:ribosome-binding factor A|nr:30S ribosome-binding factor RbfA [Gammaproteobacteria bacterium]MDP6615688.1 30S ribosome-binding factor RbfA [Gammaproteobacteria bacterium]MDP6695301.1 30S ribosome-binding factor RbfA [Gammaproteobacteria bacterium]MDP7041994.1 30S ribosome-binding factor RbfA [Gammaproteobacteria bacterium]